LRPKDHLAPTIWSEGQYSKILSVYDGENRELIIDTAFLYHLKQISRADGDLVNSWFRALHEGNRKLAQETQMEIQLRLSRQLRDPELPYVGPFSPSLGLDIQRSAKNPPAVLCTNYYSAKRFKDLLRPYVAAHSDLTLAQATKNIEEIRSQVVRSYGLGQVPALDIAWNSANPLTLIASARDTLTVDLTLALIPSEERRALLEFGVERLKRTSTYPFADIEQARMAGYFDIAESFILKSQEQREVLINGFHSLKAHGWQVDGHLSFFQRLEASADIFSSQGKSEMRRTTLSEPFRNRLNGSIADLSLLIKDLEPLKNEERLLEAVKEGHKRGYAYPTGEDVAESSQLSTYSRENIYDLLASNIPLCRALKSTRARHSGLILEAFFALLPQRDIRGDLSLGQESLLRTMIAGKGNPMTERSGELYPAVGMYSALSLLLGRPEVRDILGRTSPENRRLFLRALRGATMKSEFREDFPQAHLFGYISPIAYDHPNLKGGKLDFSGRWQDGYSFLRYGGDPERIAQLFSSLHLSGQVGCPSNFQQMEYRLQETMLKKWGIPLGLLGAQERDQVINLQQFPDVVSDIFYRTRERKTIDPDSRASRAALQLVQSTLSNLDSESARELTAWLGDKLPEMFAIPLYSEVEKFRSERLAFQVLTSKAAQPDVVVLARLVERALLSTPQDQRRESTTQYVRTLLEALGDITSSVASVEHLLSTPSDREGSNSNQQWCLERLAAAPRAQVEKFVAKLFSDARSFDHVMRRTASSPELKEFLLGALSEERRRELLGGLTTDETREVLGGISMTELRLHVSDSRGEAKGTDTLLRRLYHDHVGDLPDLVARPDYWDRVPNYFKVLGVPRNATDQMIRESYKKLSFIYHPDRFAQEGRTSIVTSEEMMKRISEAYKVLKEKSSRTAYLRELENNQAHYPKTSWLEHLPDVG
ncbi:MAG: J domain-containing protein, partial [Bdellovibrionales bacterium]|nr:J domain-containing protein [Bdellovibrionales bacterium]